MEIIHDWLQSGLPAFIRGARLLPKPHPEDESIPYGIEGSQGTAYHLVQQENNREWVLKKFHGGMQPDHSYLVAIRSLLPKHIACMVGAKRAVIGSDDLKLGNGLYTATEFAQWLQDTVLMPKIRGEAWKTVTDEIRGGLRAISMPHRLDFAKSLVEAVLALEENGCAHRDLCQQNLFLDLQEYIVYLVDFDSLFHGSLYFHKNTPPGTEGYIAPWVVDKGGKWDARKSWNRKGDRFGMAVLLAELLLADRESPSYYEGALFAQEMFFNPRHSHLLHTVDSLHNFSEALGDLFYKTIVATSYEECPPPVKWQEALAHVAFPEPLEEAAPVEVESEAQSEVAQDEMEATEIVTISPESAAKLHHWLFICILVVPLLFGGLYYARHKTKATQAGKIKPSPITQVANPTTATTKPKDIPAVVIPTVPKEGESAQIRKYQIAVKYADNDLAMAIENQKVPLNKDNTALVSIAAGTHTVSLTFTGTIFLPDGMVQRTDKITKDRMIPFGQEDKIIFQVNRKDKTWYLQNEK